MTPLTEFKYLSPAGVSSAEQKALTLVRKINAKQEEIDMIDIKLEMMK
jgi:hypothetical protein